jgi:hypothetical protein
MHALKLHLEFSTVKVVVEDGLEVAYPLAPALVASQLNAGRRRAKAKDKKRARPTNSADVNVGVERADEAWWSQGNAFAANPNTRVPKKRRVDVTGAWIEVFWSTEDGREGFYSGEVLRAADGVECESGDYVVRYDDDGQEYIEQLFVDGNRAVPLWRFQAQ